MYWGSFFEPFYYDTLTNGKLVSLMKDIGLQNFDVIDTTIYFSGLKFWHFDELDLIIDIEGDYIFANKPLEYA